MKTRILFIFLFAFIMQNMNSQNQMYREIQNKKENTVFRQIKPFQVSKKYNIPLSNQFKDKDDLLFFKYNPLSMKNAGEAINIEIPLSVNRKMEIEVVDVTDTYSYEVVTNKGHRYRPNKNIKHYRGVIKNNVNSIVALTCFENEIMGIIVTENGNFNIAYDKATGLHAFYNDRNLKDKFLSLCSTLDDASITYDSNILLNPPKTLSVRSTTLNVKYVRFYFETEFDIYQARGNSVSSVEAFVTALYNQVATLYRNEDIFTAISEIHVWTTEDPYTQVDIFGLLTQFQNIRTSINGDIGQLLNFRGLGGMAAGFNALCNVSTRQKLSVSSITQFFNAVPTYSRTIKVMTHEIGHLLGSRHTHACVWNGNNTAIDGCAIPEGGCTRPPTPTNGGTIMSYCDHIDSESYVNFNLGFGPQPGNVIRNRVNNASCLSSYSIKFTGPSTVCGQNSYTYTIQNLPPNTTVTWSSSNNSMTLISGQGMPNAVFQQTGFTNGEIRAAITPFTTLRLPITICPPSISGPSTVCDQATYSIENLPSGATVEWRTSNNRLQLVSGQGTGTAVFRKKGNGNSDIHANIRMGGTLLLRLDLTVWSGSPHLVITHVGDHSVNNQTSADITLHFGNDIQGGSIWLNNMGGSNQLQISNYSPYLFSLVHTGNKIVISPLKGGNGYFSVRTNNVCGNSNFCYVYVYVDTDCSFTLSPNPATEVVTLQLMETDKESGQSILSTARSMYEIQLWSGMRMLRSYKTNEPTFQIPVSGLPAGLYFVRVIKDGQAHTEKLMIK